MKKSPKSKAPSSHFRFTAVIEPEEVTETSSGPRRFRVLANSGRPFDDPRWGRFAVDFAGLEIPNERMPLLRDHDTTQILGFTESVRVTEQGLMAEGQFVDTAASREVLELTDQGFPFQASIYVPPTSVLRIGDGANVTVNGHELKGPGSVFERSALREVTVTALGADAMTSAEAFGEDPDAGVEFIERTVGDMPQPKTEERSEGAKLTADTFAAQHPKVHAEVTDAAFAAGVAEERDRVAYIFKKAGPDRAALAAELAESGASKFDALEALLEAKPVAEKAAPKIEATESVAELEAQVYESDAPSTSGGDSRFAAEWAANENHEKLIFRDKFDRFCDFRRAGNSLIEEGSR